MVLRTCLVLRNMLATVFFLWQMPVKVWIGGGFLVVFGLGAAGVVGTKGLGYTGWVLVWASLRVLRVIRIVACSLC